MISLKITKSNILLSPVGSVACFISGWFRFFVMQNLWCCYVIVMLYENVDVQ